MMFDVIIIGAGPAGATFARLAERHLNILLVEKSTEREKCCGGLVAPDAQKMLARFDLGIPKEIISDPQLFYVRSIDLETNREGKYQRHYTNINRRLLDQYLIKKLPSNVKHMAGGQYLGHRQEKGEIIVSIRQNGEVAEHSCSVLVGADGAHSSVRKALYDDFRKIRKYLAIEGEYRLETTINHYAVFFDRSISDFYSWLIPKGDTVLVGGAFDERNNAKQKYKKLIKEVVSYGYSLGDPVKLDACYLLRPRLKDIKTGQGGVALIGEAAGLISPSSSEGLSYAYRSAYTLAKTLKDVAAFDIKRYDKGILGLRINIFMKNIKGLFIYNSFLRNMIFKMNIGTLKNAR